MRQTDRIESAARHAKDHQTILDRLNESVSQTPSEGLFVSGTRKLKDAPVPTIRFEKNTPLTQEQVMESSFPPSRQALKAADALWARNLLAEDAPAFLLGRDGVCESVSRRSLARRMESNPDLCESALAGDEPMPFFLLKEMEEVLHLQTRLLEEADGKGVSVGALSMDSLLEQQMSSTQSALDVLAEGVIEEALKAQRLKRQSSSQRAKGRSAYRKKKGSINRKRKRLRKTPGFKRKQVKLARMKKGRKAGARRRFVMDSREQIASLAEGLGTSKALVESKETRLSLVWTESLSIQRAALSLAEALERVVVESEEDDVEESMKPYQEKLDELNMQIASGKLQLPTEAVEAMKSNLYLMLTLDDGLVQDVKPFGDDSSAFDAADEAFEGDEEIDATAVYDTYGNELVYFNSDEVAGAEDSESSEMDEGKILESRNHLRLASDLREAALSCNDLKRLDEGAIVEESEVKSVLGQIAALCESACQALLAVADAQGEDE
ncbi:MAG: hypothetical protein ACRCXD_09870 [Luteolibacter sp.]